MSRLIVKSLPGYLDEKRLRTHFGALPSGSSSTTATSSAQITDVSIRRGRDGSSRRFGFVGFKSPEAAQAAKQYFDGTFIDTSRIQVDFARKIGDESLTPRGTKRNAPLHSSANSGVAATIEEPNAKRRAGAKRTASQPPPSKGGVTFEEFMAVMNPRSKRKTWANEEASDARDIQAPTVETGLLEEPAAAQVKQGEKKEKKQKAKLGADPPPAPAEESSNGGVAEGESPPRDAVVMDENISDMDYLARRMTRHVAPAPAAPEPKAFEQSDDEGEQLEAASSVDEADASGMDAAAEEALKAEKRALEEKAQKEQEVIDAIMTTGRLFLRNLPFATKEEELTEHFERWGEVKQAHIVLDKETKQSKGMGFVTFQDPIHALEAYRAADGADLQGRLLHILPAVDPHPGWTSNTAGSLKQKRQDKRRELASRDFNWSSLYMSADAVASSVADRLGVAKAQLLGASADDAGRDSSNMSAAVKVALAETRVIQETRQWLEEHGIDVEAFSGSAEDGATQTQPRSDTTLLVKNIPYGTMGQEIEALFARHGSVARVLLPPAGTMAVVEMEVPGEARVALRALAYRRIGSSVLYLERAPAGVFKPSTDDGATSADDSAPTRAAKPAPPPRESATTAKLLLGSGVGAEAEVEPGATLFVKNLSFATTDRGLADAFSPLEGFAFCRVQTRLGKAVVPPGTSAAAAAAAAPRLSMGYGFVGFRSVEAARAAKAAMQGRELDGHALSLDFARRGRDADDDATDANGTAVGASSSSKTTKIVVKNLAFEATKAELRALFGAHGQLKSVRLPRKPPASGAGGRRGAGGGATSTRGFGFVEFTSRREAEAAMAALRHSHLLGRHLVLRWDDEDARGVDALRSKEALAAAAGGRGVSSVDGRKTKLRLGNKDIKEAARKERAQREEEDDDDDDEVDGDA